MGDDNYEISLNFWEITKIVARDGMAAWPEDPAFEVLSTQPLTVQGKGCTTVYFAENGQCRQVPVTVGKEEYAVTIEK